MSKELEAWNFIKDQMQNFTFSHLVDEMVKNADIVEQALQRLEAIDKANPSEAIKQRIEKLKKEKAYYEEIYDYENSKPYQASNWRCGQARGKVEVLEKEIEFLEKLVGAK